MKVNIFRFGITSTLALLLLNMPSVEASIPRTEENLSSVLMALSLPAANRMQVLQARGPKSSSELSHLAFDEKRPLQIRWRAITSMAQLRGPLAMPEMERALKSDQWFIRNAGLVGLKRMNREQAIPWANRLLNDSALVVRTAAVEVLEHFRATESEDLLWNKLNAKENFHKGEGLWIRKYIAKALASMAHPGQEQKFLALLKDKDERIHPFAQKGLDRIRR